MALQATFAADFTRFERSIQQASVHLQVFDRATKTATRSLTREVESFSGQKLAVEASRMVEAVNRIGGVSKLTDAELKRLTGTLDAVAQKAGRMGESLSPAISKMRAEVEKLPKATTDSANSMGLFSGSLGSALKNMVPFATAAGIVTGAVAGITKALKDGAQLAAISQGFTALAGSAANATATLEAMRLGTRGLVTDLDIMQASNKAMLLGLGLNAQGMGDLAKTAQVLGRAMGLDATTALDNLITALGRSSPLILDNLGLTVKVGEANEKYAAELGKAASELTDAESKQAFMNAAMEAANQRVTELGEQTLTLSDRFSILTTDISNATAAFGAMIQKSPALNSMFEGLIDSLQIGLPRALLEGQIKLFEFAASMSRLSERIPTLRSALGKSAEDTKFFEGELRRAKDTLEAFDMAGQKSTRTSQLAAPPIVAVAQAAGVQGKALKDTTKAIDDNEKAMQKLADAIRAMGRDASGSFGAQLMIASGALGKLETDLSKSEQAFIKTNEAMNVFGRDASGSFGLDLMLASGALGKISTELDKLPPKVKTVGDSLRENLLGTLQGIPQTIADAFTGGGDITGALKAIFSQLGSDLGKMVADAFSFSGQWGQAIGGAIGSLAGLIVNPLKKLFGIGINEPIRLANAEIEELRKNLIDQYGDLARLEGIARALGLSFEANWGHQGQEGLRQFNELIKEFEERLDRANREFDPLLRSAIELGIRLPESLLLAIQQLRDLGVLTEGNAELLDRLAGAADVDWRKMQEAAERYGIGVDNLGDQFNQLRLNASAEQIINDFDLLTRGGVSVGAALSGMREEISKFVQESLRAGTTIPRNMQAWIEELARSGQLTDDSGEAMTDLSRLRFADPIETEFEKITRAIEELIEAIRGPLTDAITNLPSPDLSIPEIPVLPGTRPRPIPTGSSGAPLLNKPSLSKPGAFGGGMNTSIVVGDVQIVAQPGQDGRALAYALVDTLRHDPAIRSKFEVMSTGRKRGASYG